MGLAWVYLATRGILPLVAALDQKLESQIKWSHLEGIKGNTDLVWSKTICFLYCYIIYQFCSSNWVLLGKLLQVLLHLPIAKSHTYIEFK
jgi:hypothetical protein